MVYFFLTFNNFMCIKNNNKFLLDLQVPYEVVVSLSETYYKCLVPCRHLIDMNRFPLATYPLENFRKILGLAAQFPLPLA